jgi:hypothetical protein
MLTAANHLRTIRIIADTTSRAAHPKEAASWCKAAFGQSIGANFSVAPLWQTANDQAAEFLAPVRNT